MTTKNQNDEAAAVAAEDHGLTSELVKQVNRATEFLTRWADCDLDFYEDQEKAAFDIVERLESALVALERSEHGTVGALIWHLLADYRLDEPCAHDLWLADDVHQQAKEEDFDALTNDEVAEVLAFVQRHKDATLGINWDTISCALDEVCPAKRGDNEP